MRLWRVLVFLLAPLTLTLTASDVPATPLLRPPQQAKEVSPLAREAGDLYFVAIGQQDNWKFLPEGFARVIRDQDKALYRAIHGRVLVGPQATRKELLGALDGIGTRARANDLVMVFIACHGRCTAAGESVFATRRGSVRPREIKARLARLPCQAIVVNDACQSGNWPKEFPPDDVMPPNVTALCCCLANQNSGIEFDITLFEALYGKADFNKDGVVDLDEVIRYCALRIREVQGGRLTPVLHKAKNLKRALPLTKANPGLVSVVHSRQVFAAVVEKQDGDTYVVRVVGFDKPGRAGLGGGTVPDRFTRANILLPTDGAALMVRKERGGWYPACLVGKAGADCKVRYVGSDGDAVVDRESVRHLFAGNPKEIIPPGLFQRN
jgi:hypothetical protein